MPTDRPTLSMTPAIYQILLALADAERHGYGIMQEVAERTEDEVRLGPGTLYRSIKQMRQAGLIQATESDDRLDEDGDRRRFYRITTTGRRALEWEAERLTRLVAQARGKHVIDELGKA